MAYSKTDIQQGFYETVGKVFNLNTDDLTAAMNWKEDLNVKSVHGMKLCAYLNHKFQIKLPMSNLIECNTLGDAVDMLDKFIND